VSKKPLNFLLNVIKKIKKKFLNMEQKLLYHKEVDQRTLKSILQTVNISPEEFKDLL